MCFTKIVQMSIGFKIFCGLGIKPKNYGDIMFVCLQFFVCFMQIKFVHFVVWILICVLGLNSNCYK
jgi:hypothetical protein